MLEKLLIASFRGTVADEDSRVVDQFDWPATDSRTSFTFTSRRGARSE